MNIIRDLAELPAAARTGAVTIGNFDGVHLGHARIVKSLIAKSQDLAGPAVVFTFDPHPVRILRPDQSPPPLTWTERKAELLRALGVEWLIVFPTDEALLALSPREFFQRIVLDALGAQAIVEGANFYFGRDRSGTIDVLRGLVEDAGMELTVVAPYRVEDECVSSSLIRRYIREGQVQRACQMLTEPYRIRGLVTHGDARGVRLGFPTANLDGIDTLLPAQGVYAGRGFVNGRCLPAAIHLGPSPTFGLGHSRVEVHLVDFHESLYGQPLEVDFLDRLRDIHPFGSVEALKAQLARDVQATRTIYHTVRER